MARRAAIKALPSKADLDRLLSYEPRNGVLTWRVLPDDSPSAIGFNRRCGGKQAGTISFRGYRSIGIRGNGKLTYYYAHRLIWKMMTGYDPVEQVDHIDGDRDNNRWANLRAASANQNMWNRKLHRNNQCKSKGVTLREVGNYRRWRANIQVNGVMHRLGDFKSLAEAKAARTAAAERLHGEYFREI